MTRPAALVVVVAAAVLGGCDGGPAPGRTPTPVAASGAIRSGAEGAASPTDTAAGDVLALDCAAPIDDPATLPSSAVRLGAGAALSSEPGTPAEQPGASGREARFAKVGLLVRPGWTLTVAVSDDDRDHAVVGWGNTGGWEPAATFEVPGCPVPAGAAGATSASGPAWLVYPGGIWVDAPRCVRLDVTDATGVTHLAVPVGEPCG